MKYICKKKNIKNLHEIKLGILGAGQLGRMLAQEASPLDIDLHFLDKAKDFPAGKISNNVHEGDFKNYDDVMAFGMQMDVISIEIENVNTDALKDLEAKGKKVFPQSRVISTIKDKGLQKQFYKDKGLPTSDFILVKDEAEIKDLLAAGKLQFPFVQKSREAGYDGKGVAVIHSEKDHYKMMNTPSVIEDLVEIDAELAVIIGRTQDGTMINFPTVEMVFNPKGNLLDYLLSPALISESLKAKCVEVARTVAEKLDIVGVLAVELFLDKSGNILINEVAPRTHNSGHQTIDSQRLSQFGLHLRTVLGLPLVQEDNPRKALMINLLGEPGESGLVCYEGLEDILKLPDVYVHLYGKKETKPLRKMGHLTILFDDLRKAKEIANFVKSTLKVRSCRNMK